MRLAWMVLLAACGSARVDERRPVPAPPLDAAPPAPGVKPIAGGSAVPEPVVTDDTSDTYEPRPPPPGYSCIVGSKEPLIVLAFDGESPRGGDVTRRFRFEAGSNLNERVELTTVLVAHNQRAPTWSNDCVASVGRRDRFDWVVFGTVTTNGGRGTVTVRLISTADPKTTRATTFEYVTRRDLFVGAHDAWIRLTTK